MRETVYGVVGYALVDHHQIGRQLIASDQESLNTLSRVCGHFSIVTLESEGKLQAVALVGSNAEPQEDDISSSLFRSITEFADIRTRMDRAFRIRLTPLRSVPQLDRRTIESIMNYMLMPTAAGSELVN